MSLLLQLLQTAEGRGKHLLLRYSGRCLLPVRDGTDAEPRGSSYHHHSDFLTDARARPTSIFKFYNYQSGTLAARCWQPLRTLEVCKINHISCSVFVLTEYLIWFFWSPNLQKYFWVFGKAFYCNIATASILKTLKVQHTYYIKCVGFNIFDPPNLSPEQALPIQAITYFTYNVFIYHQYLLHQKVTLWNQPAPKRETPPLQPWYGRTHTRHPT